MYIMAAVDINTREFRRAVRGREREGGARQDQQKFATSTAPEIHEHVLCVIRAHQNGTLEVAPGFSAEEPESGDEGAFLTEHTTMEKEGPRLTAYTFGSPLGGLFSYTVENASEPVGGVEEMEEWEAENAVQD
ncbi:unnamed protein product, partial [Choristocarpus tenellus]